MAFKLPAFLDKHFYANGRKCHGYDDDGDEQERQEHFEGDGLMVMGVELLSSSKHQNDV